MSDSKVINFMGRRKLAAIFSTILLVASVTALAVKGLSFGLDFTGGTLIELHYPQTADLNGIRADLKNQGYPSAVVANFGSDQDVVIRIQSDGEKVGDTIVESLKGAYQGDGTVVRKRIEYVGSQVGEEFMNDGGLGMYLPLPWL
jgi:protein translocase subunit secF